MSNAQRAILNDRKATFRWDAPQARPSFSNGDKPRWLQKKSHVARGLVSLGDSVGPAGRLFFD